MDYAKTFRLTLYFTAAVLAVLGAWCMTYPAEAIMAAAVYIGVAMCLTGLNHIVPCLSMRGADRPLWLACLGVLDIAVGVIMLSEVWLSAFMLPLFMAAWMMMTAIVRAGFSLRLMRRGVRRWWVMLLSALVMAVCASAMFASPIIGIISAAWALGLSLISAGVMIFAECRLIFN